MAMGDTPTSEYTLPLISRPSSRSKWNRSSMKRKLSSGVTRSATMRTAMVFRDTFRA